METRRRRCGGTVLAMTMLTLLLSGGTAGGQDDYYFEPVAPRKVIIGVATDGPSQLFDELSNQVTVELGQLTGIDLEVYFKQVPAFGADWDLSKVPKALKSALRDREVELVFTAGVLVTEAAGRPSLKLSKPVVGGVAMDADVLGLPYDEEGRSTKENFNFIVTPSRAVNDIKTFRKLVPFDTLHLLLDEKLLQGIEGLQKNLDELEKSFGIRVVTVPVGERAGPVLDKLKKDVEAVYLTPPLRMGDAERKKLFEGFKTLKIPSFSMRGYREVEEGVLAGLASENTERLARRIALNIQQILLGVSPTELPVNMPLEEQLVINGETAVAVGYVPDFETMMIADFFHEEALETGEDLSLRRAVGIALRNNIDLVIQQDQVETTRQDKNKAGSFMLPQVSGDFNYTRIDRDRAEASAGSQPEEVSTLGLSASQMIFDDEVVSSYRSAKRLYEGSLYDEDAAKLDVVETASIRYLRYLQARAVVKAERDNLKLTRSNLELAKVRREVGIAGPEEVYRWESEQAKQRARVLAARSDEERARVALNQTLGVDQRIRWKPEDIVLEDEERYFLEGRIGPMVDNPVKLENFRQFSVFYAYEQEPNLQSIRKSIEAQAIQLGRLKRKFVVPKFRTGFQLDHEVDSKEVGETSIPGFEDFDLGGGTNDNDWSWNVSVTLPLFEGGGRFHDVARERSELNRLENTRVRLRQLIDQQVQSAVYAIESSQPNIRLTRVAAEQASKNLEVVQDKYKRGTVPIIDLLDAQNQAFVSNLEATIAVYAYLEDLMRYQRAIAWFEIDKTEEEKEQWLARLDSFLESGHEELPTLDQGTGRIRYGNPPDLLPVTKEEGKGSRIED